MPLSVSVLTVLSHASNSQETDDGNLQEVREYQMLARWVHSLPAGKLLKEQLNKSSETYIQISFFLLIYFKDDINYVLLLFYD